MKITIYTNRHHDIVYTVRTLRSCNGLETNNNCEFTQEPNNTNMKEMAYAAFPPKKLLRGKQTKTRTWRNAKSAVSEKPNRLSFIHYLRSSYHKKPVPN